MLKSSYYSKIHYCIKKELPYCCQQDKGENEKRYFRGSFDRYIRTIKLFEKYCYQQGSKHRILDVGAYPGHLALILRNVYGCLVYGVSGTTSGGFERKMEEYGINIRKLNIEKQRLPFDNKSFDTVFLTEVIEHLFNPYLVIREVGRVLKENGVLILSTPNFVSLRKRIHFLQGKSILPIESETGDILWSDKEMWWRGHVREWTSSEISLVLSRHSLLVKKISFYMWSPIDPKLNFFKERILRASCKLIPSFRDCIIVVASKERTSDAPSTLSKAC